MDDLFPCVSQLRAEGRLGVDPFKVPKIHRDHVDRLQAVGCTGRHHSRTGEEQFKGPGCARCANIGGVIFTAENQTVQARMRGELPEIQDRPGRLHTQQHADRVDRPAVCQFRCFDLSAGPLDLFQCLHFWHNDPVRAEGQDSLNIFRLQPRANRVDAHQLFGSAKGQLLQGSSDAPARITFAVQRHPVFHVHGYAVHVEREGFFDLMTVITGHVEQGTSCTHGVSNRANYAMNRYNHGKNPCITTPGPYIW